MTQEKATAQRCGHNHSTNFNWETKAAYDDGQMLCWDCNQMFTPEPLPQTYGSLANQRDALLSEVAELREALKSIAKCACKHGNQATCLDRYQNAVKEHFTETFQRELLSTTCPACVAARALLGKSP